MKCQWKYKRAIEDNTEQTQVLVLNTGERSDDAILNFPQLKYWMNTKDAG